MTKPLVLFLCISSAAFSQCKTWNWPNNKALAEEKMVMLQDALNSKDFSHARAPLYWLLLNAPGLHNTVYIHGVTIYEGMINNSQNPDLRQRYLDSILTIYDLRLALCGDKKNVINRKALTLFRYTINGPNPDAILMLMDEALRICQNDISDATLVPYMETLVVSQQKGKRMTQDEIKSRYKSLSTLIDYKLKHSGNDQTRRAKLLEYQLQIDQLLMKIIDVTCPFIQSILKPRFLKDAQNLSLAKQVFSNLLKAKCPVDQLWLTAGEVIFKNEPDFGLAKNIGIEYYLRGEIEKSQNYFFSSLSLAPSRSDSSDIYILQGSLWARTRSPQQAREAFRAALRLQPSRTDAYIKIGDLYYNSFEPCSKKINRADDRLVYLIAFDYYAKAGDKSKMELAHQAFPSVEEIFLLNYQVGQRIKVGCWINEFTTLRTRD